MLIITFMSLPLAIMPKHWYLQHLLLFVQHILHEDVEQDTLSQASMYNILRKDVEQNKLSQASTLLASMPKTRVFTAFLPLCAAYCAHSAFLLRKTPAAPETYKTHKNYFVIADTRSCLMRGFVGPDSTFGTS